MTDPSAADVDLVLQQLALAERTDLASQGLRTAYDSPPPSVSPADLPAIINLPGPMTLTPMGSDEYADEDQEARTYNVLLIISPRGAGYPGEAFNKVTPWFARMAKFFSSHQALSTAQALKVELRGDSGVTQPIEYAGTSYFGTRYDLVITGRRRSPYAPHE